MPVGAPLLVGGGLFVEGLEDELANCQISGESPAQVGRDRRMGGVIAFGLAEKGNGPVLIPGGALNATINAHGGTEATDGSVGFSVPVACEFVRSGLALSTSPCRQAYRSMGEIALCTNARFSSRCT